jgi:hypothetical protein
MPSKTKLMKRAKSKTASASKKNENPKRGLAKKSPGTKLAVKTKSASRKKIAAKRKSVPKKKVTKKKQNAETAVFSFKTARVRSGRQSGDLQGLSEREGADSESVSELLEEGNTFEAGVVSGVEAADSDEGEVHTHEVPEDDVPEEYLDEE